MLTTGERIRLERKSRGWTQEELALHLEVSALSVKRWESGLTEPQGHNRIRVLTFLGIPTTTRKHTQEKEASMPDQIPEPHASTYVMPNSQRELERLHEQSRLVEYATGGRLAEQPDPARFHRVLDIGCGTGEWLIGTAKDYPHMRLVGIDTSESRLAFAREQSGAQGVSDRVEFRMMDALAPLAFSDESFDLVNLRFGVSFVREWDWQNVVREIHRVLDRGGTARLVDAHYLHSNSAALNQFWVLISQAAHQSGHRPKELAVGENATTLFPRYLEVAGFSHIESRVFAYDYHPGSPAFALFAEDVRALLVNFAPFVRKWINADEYAEMSAQALADLERPDFEASIPFEAVWGIR